MGFRKNNIEPLDFVLFTRQMQLSLLTGERFLHDDIMVWLSRLFKTMDLMCVIDESKVETVFLRKDKWIAHTDHRSEDSKMRLWFSVDFLAGMERKFKLPYSIGDLERLLMIFLSTLVEGNPNDVMYDVFRNGFSINHCYDLKYSRDRSIEGYFAR